MRKILVAVAVTATVLCQPLRALSDDFVDIEIPAVVGVAALALLATDVISLAVNTQAVANGHGKAGAGWTGIVAGSVTTALALGSLDEGEDNTAPLIMAAGGIATLGMGFWSLMLVEPEPDLPVNSSLSVGTTAERRMDGVLEARLGLMMTF